MASVLWKTPGKYFRLDEPRSERASSSSEKANNLDDISVTGTTSGTGADSAADLITGNNGIKTSLYGSR